MKNKSDIIYRHTVRFSFSKFYLEKNLEYCVELKDCLEGGYPQSHMSGHYSSHMYIDKFYDISIYFPSIPF